MRSTTHRMTKAEMLIPKAFSSHATIRIVSCFITPCRNQKLIKITAIHCKKNHNMFNRRDLIKYSLDLVRNTKAGQVLYKGQASVLRYNLNLQSMRRYLCLLPLRPWPHSRYRSLKNLKNSWPHVHCSLNPQHWSKPRNLNQVTLIRLEKCLSLLRKKPVKKWNLMDSSVSLRLLFVPEGQIFTV